MCQCVIHGDPPSHLLSCGLYSIFQGTRADKVCSQSGKGPGFSWHAATSPQLLLSWAANPKTSSCGSIVPSSLPCLQTLLPSSPLNFLPTHTFLLALLCSHSHCSFLSLPSQKQLLALSPQCWLLLPLQIQPRGWNCVRVFYCHCGPVLLALGWSSSFPLFSGLGTFVEDHLIVYSRVYFWGLELWLSGKAPA